MLVPVAVFAPRGANVAGYRSAAPATPAWWDEDAPLAPLPQSEPRQATTLLDISVADPEWIPQLLGSQLYVTQRERFARTAPDDAHARRVLSILAARNGHAAVAAIAQAIDAPEYQTRNALAGLRRVLAVDGFDVLAIHDDDVMLDGELLAQLFGLSVGQSSE